MSLNASASWTAGEGIHPRQLSRFKHIFFRTPEPPFLGLSKQFWHSLQSGRVQKEHIPQRIIRARLFLFLQSSFVALLCWSDSFGPPVVFVSSLRRYDRFGSHNSVVLFSRYTWQSSTMFFAFGVCPSRGWRIKTSKTRSSSIFFART